MKDSQLLTRQFQQKKPPDQDRVPGRWSSFFGIVFAVVLTGFATAALFNRQWIIDQYEFMTFKPTAEVVGFASRAGLNDTGKFYLYASKAEVDDRAAFNAACSKLLNEKTVVLGCYTGAQKRIYIFNVTDSRLDGVEDVTAAHEMLHAAYDRLSTADKKRVDELLIAQEKIITDPRVLNLIKEYKTSEPSEIANEMHSIFGTELRNLTPELEVYYARYFSDRSAVVTLTEKYEKVFTDLSTQQTQLINQLNAIASDVNTRQQSYQAAMSSLNSDIAAFNTWAQSGAATQATYNTKRAALQTRISALDAERDAINDEIDDYNTKKSELDALNMQAENLNQSINSQLPSSAPAL